jgi:branched-chain amino acid transport system substrate-binding protein
MTRQLGVTRRQMGTLVFTGTLLAMPWVRRVAAAEPIKIGMPLALTGPLGSVGQQLKRGGEMWAKVRNATGGLLGRPIQPLIEDTGGNPADAVRKSQEMVERDKCNILTGITLSSEALAVAPKLDEWNAIFLSSDNGDGKLTAGALVPNFFRANISAPMGARAVSLFLRQSNWQKFYAIGMDYAWGHSSVGVFESEIKHAKKDLVGTVFSPIGTKDFSTYITKIRQSGAEALYIVMAGDDFNAFLAQAAQYKLPEKVQMLTEQMELTLMRAVGDVALGLIGSTATPSRSTTRRTRNSSRCGRRSTGLFPTPSKVSNGRPCRSSPRRSRSPRAPIPKRSMTRSKLSRSTTSRALSRCANATIRRCRTALW